MDREVGTRGKQERAQGRRVGMPSPALVVAIIALIVASTGTGLAASGVLIHSSKQIAPHVIKGVNIASNTIGPGNLAVAVRSKLGGGTQQTAASLAPSAIGSAGRETIRKQGPTGLTAGQSARIATMSALGPGVWAIFAKTILTYTGPTQDVLSLITQQPPSTGAGHCTLNAAGDGDYAAAPVRTFFSNSPGELHMQITVTQAAPGDVTVDCGSDDPWRASDTSIIAVQLSAAPKSSVQG
jgi:hypothetical protein